FQVSFTMLNAPLTRLTLPGLQVQGLVEEELKVRFDLELHAWERDGRFTVSWVYNRDLFDRWRIEQMARHYGRILDAVLVDDTCRVDDIALLDATEQQRIVSDWNPHPALLPPTTLPALFEAQVVRTPDATALVCTDQHVTYATLNARANQLAHLLIRHGAGPEKIVGLAVPRSLDMVVALLGITKTGAAYLPLDLEYPTDRLALMMRDAEPVVVMTTIDNAHRIPPSSRLLIDDYNHWHDAIGPEDIDFVKREWRSTNAAYIMYTSGSTGIPKGVVVTHGNVSRLVQQATYVSLDESERVLQMAPVSFDASTFEIWGCLTNGGTLVVCETTIPTLDELGCLLARQQVTTAWLTAGLFHAMVVDRLDELAGLTQLLAGGDILLPGDVHRVSKRLEGLSLINGYGPTEATTFSCCHKVMAFDEKAVSVPIGRPIADARIYVLDGRLRTVPPGVPGEVYIAGTGVARGYLNQAVLTAERFVPSLYDLPGTRMYRTGDIAQWQTDGLLDFVGRVDQQVKVRGFRAEPAEIERTLLEDGAVQQAVVVSRRSGTGDKHLVAYVVLSEGCVISCVELRQRLRRILPDYLIPAVIVALDSMPIAPNGKIDRSALPEPQFEVTARGPQTPEETIICHIFSEALSIARVGVDDDFFMLGGHSLLATRVVSRIRAVFGVALTIGDLFDAPTVSGCASILQERLAEKLEKMSENELAELRRHMEAVASATFSPQDAVSYNSPPSWPSSP
ncbi:MAG: non-ribosomal peptide synthetase, partial [Acidobacteria bacterium]